MSELLPCPFCGGEGEMRESSTHDFYVKCRGCGAATRRNHENRTGAVIDWNTRAEHVTVYPDGEHGIKVNGITYVPERTCHYKEHDALVVLSCDVCGHGSLYRPNYCPSCGAKVVGE